MQFAAFFARGWFAGKIEPGPTWRSEPLGFSGSSLHLTVGLCCSVEPTMQTIQRVLDAKLLKA